MSFKIMTVKTTHLPKSNQKMVDFTVEFFWKPRLEIESNQQKPVWKKSDNKKLKLI